MLDVTMGLKRRKNWIGSFPYPPLPFPSLPFPSLPSLPFPSLDGATPPSAISLTLKTYHRVVPTLMLSRFLFAVLIPTLKYAVKDVGRHNTRYSS